MLRLTWIISELIRRFTRTLTRGSSYSLIFHFPIYMLIDYDVKIIIDFHENTSSFHECRNWPKMNFKTNLKNIYDYLDFTLIDRKEGQKSF